MDNWPTSPVSVVFFSILCNEEGGGLKSAFLSAQSDEWHLPLMELRVLPPVVLALAGMLLEISASTIVSAGLTGLGGEEREDNCCSGLPDRIAKIS